MSKSNRRKSFLVALEVSATDAHQAEDKFDRILSNCENALDTLADVEDVITSDVSVHCVMPWDDAMKLLHPEESAHDAQG